MTNKYKLSICVPTYNRHDFLVLCLDRLVSQIGDRKDIEVLVVDNASSDNTRKLLKSFDNTYEYFRYLTRDETINAYAQVGNTLISASGEWAVYLADDDWLDVGIVLEHIHFAEEHEQIVSAIYCDWSAWDDESGRELHRYFHVEGDHVFAPKNSVELLNFVLQKGVLAEVGIYRVALMREAFVNGVMKGDFYQNLLGLHRSGTIVFRDPPFYRENRVIKQHLKRTTWANMGDGDEDAGNQQLETLRSQMERLSVSLLGPSGINSENADKVWRRINRFMIRRMLVWRNRALSSHNWSKALEFDARITLFEPELGLPKTRVQGKIDLKSLTLLAALQNFIKAMAVDSVSTLAVSNAINQSALDCLLNEIKRQEAKLPVELIDLETHDIFAGSGTAYLVLSAEEQAVFASKGGSSRMVTNLGKLVHTVNVGLNLPSMSRTEQSIQIMNRGNGNAAEAGGN
jgi:glycosyltransferase involved in cell wall biosynthesis